MGSNPTLGILLAMCGCFCSACGYTLQKLAHRRAAASSSASYWRYWQFIAGMGMLIIGSIFAVAVFGLAGQAELAPMGAVTLIFNELLAWRVLRESFTRVDALSVALMGMGTTIALAGAVKANAAYSIDAILALLTRPAGVAYTTLALCLIAGLILFIARMTKRPVETLTRGEAAADAFSRAFVGGMLGGFTGFLVKAVVEIVVSMVAASRWSDALRVEPYLLGAALALCLPNQVRFMNSGLSRYESNRIIPVYQCTLVFASALCGYVLWDEARVATPASMATFVIGCALAMAGMLVLMWKEPVAAASLPTSQSSQELRAMTATGSSAPSSGAPSPKLRAASAQGDALHNVSMTLQASPVDERATLIAVRGEDADLRPLHLSVNGEDYAADVSANTPVVTGGAQLSVRGSERRLDAAGGGSGGSTTARKRQSSMSPDVRSSMARVGPSMPPPGMDRATAALASTGRPGALDAATIAADAQARVSNAAATASAAPLSEAGSSGGSGTWSRAGSIARQASK